MAKLAVVSATCLYCEPHRACYTLMLSLRPLTYAMTLIYEKTDKGREEIATRKYQLPSKLRTLLVMVDGEQTMDSLLQKVSPLGLNEKSLAQLVDQEFVRKKNGYAG